jgi:hypothetical protein
MSHESYAKVRPFWRHPVIRNLRGAIKRDAIALWPIILVEARNSSGVWQLTPQQLSVQSGIGVRNVVRLLTYFTENGWLYLDDKLWIMGPTGHVDDTDFRSFSEWKSCGNALRRFRDHPIYHRQLQRWREKLLGKTKAASDAFDEGLSERHRVVNNRLTNDDANERTNETAMKCTRDVRRETTTKKSPCTEKEPLPGKVPLVESHSSTKSGVKKTTPEFKAFRKRYRHDPPKGFRGMTTGKANDLGKTDLDGVILDLEWHLRKHPKALYELADKKAKQKAPSRLPFLAWLRPIANEELGDPREEGGLVERMLGG